MKSILVRTGSGPIQAPLVILSPKGSFSEHDSSVGISFPGRNSITSPRSVLHSELKDKAQLLTNFRRTLSDSDLIRSENSRFRSLNRVFSRSLPARIAEDEDFSEQSVDLQTEGEADKGSSILKRKGLELGISGILPANEVQGEELESSGGGMGKGRKVGGGNGGGRGGDGGGNGDQNGIGAYYEEMLKANPGNPLLLMNYGKFLHEVEKDFERAEEYYGRAILANPGDGEVLSLYGKLIWETQRDQGRAHSYFDQAVNACPDDCYVPERERERERERMATVSAWGKPGAWALDSEEQEAKDHVLEQQQQQKDKENERFLDSSESTQQPLADFPSLAAAVTTKSSKKKKSQPVSLAEFTIGKQVTHGSGKSPASPLSKGLTPDEQLLLPTGPRTRTAEELERSSSRIGGAFNSYSSSGPRRYPTEDQPPRRNNSVNNGPSRADEIDDWGASKKSAPPPSSDRRDRGGFFDSQSRADESDSWVSTKSYAPAPEGRRPGSGGFEGFKERKGGFDMFHKEGTNGGADSDSWGKKREEGSGSDSWGRKREEGSGSDTWGRKREEVSGSDAWGRKREELSGGRPRLNLQPRTVPVTNGDPQQGPGKSKGSNPFGEARPREEVLAEKGQDWKKIDEQLESVKIKETSPSAASSDGPSFGKKSFGSGNGRATLPEDRTERNWRKGDSAPDDTPRAEKNENGEVADN